MIIDFGLVNAKSRTAGTPSYMAPEQTGGPGPHTEEKWWIVEGWDQRLFDSWALGITLKKCFRSNQAS